MSNFRHVLSLGNFFQNWSNIGLLSTNDDWSQIASIIGFRGDEITALTGADPQTLNGDGLITPDVNVNLTNPNTFATGGVAEFELVDPTIALAGSGTADAPHLVIYLDATGRENIVFSFNARDLDGSGDNAVQQVAVQYRPSDTGPWINLPAGYIADATQGPNLAGGSIPVTVTLPADANNAANLQVRVMTTNAVGNDEWVGIDDISVTSQEIIVAQPGTLSIADASVAEGNSGSTQLSLTVSRTGGSAGAVSASYELTFGTATADDFAAGQLFTGTVNFADGETSRTITFDVAGDADFEADEDFTVTLSSPTGGATLGDAVATGTITNDDAAPTAPANVFINEIHYDNAGADSGELVEVAGLAGTDLSGWTLVLYNGNGGAAYATIALSGILPDQDDGYGTLSFAGPAAGIQNGAPDGLALVDNLGRVIQFLSYEGVMTATAGPASGLTSVDIGVSESGSDAAGFSLQLTGSGSSYEDFTWAPSAAGTAGAINTGQNFISPNGTGLINVADVSVQEGDSGIAELVFIVRRAGGGAQTASVDYLIQLGTASADDLGAGAVLSGTATFNVGDNSVRIVVPIAGDLVGELNETLQIQLSNAVGNISIIDGTATGTIANDDPIALSIMEIQGASHRSAYAGQEVITGGIVTAVDSDGFYLQNATGDGNRATSDAIFVFTTGAPTVAVGDAVSASGVVQEFLPGNNPDNLTVTRINLASVTVESSGNALPAAVLIGTGGILAPTEAYDSDSFTIFNPETDGLDFYESLEGMRVTIDAPIVTSPTNGFGETTVVASGGTGATGINNRGGTTISAGDFNPERIQIDDDSGLFAGYIPGYSQGDILSSVTGVVSYNFTSYEVLVTEAVTVTTDAPALARETTTLVGDEDHLSMATYNLSNLDPSDTTFNLLANDIVYSLSAPDILAVQEIQDADGAGTGSNLSGTVTAQLLIDAIVAAGGPRYVYVEVAPTTPNSTGGEPNGNIRNGYFYNPDRVSYVAGSATAIDGSTYNGTRRPLAAQFEFNGQTILAIDVHFTSRIGSDPTTGATQPPSNAGDSARTAQAGGVAAYVNNQLATNPNLNVAVLGDFNGFWFENAVGTLVTTAGLNRASDLLPEEERYSYVFDGNAQQIDHILLSNGLYAGARYDAVHINAEFSGATRPSDHDPQVVLLHIPVPNAAPTNLVISNEDIAENSAAGTPVGTLSATDRASDVLTYSLVDDAGGRFTVDPVTGLLTAVGPLDFETASSFDVVARVTDQGGLFTELTITINVTNVNEEPTAVNDMIAVDEDGSTANLWDLLLGNDFDPDAGDTLTITSTGGTTLGTVQFDPVARTLVYVADNASFDPLRVGESATDSFTYTITDAGGLTSTATVAITVNGIADPGVTRFGTFRNDTLNGTDGDDTLYGLLGNDILNGGNGHDRLWGGVGNDRLNGGNDDDLLSGGIGNDILNGGAGRDQLSGDIGNDVLTGGAGADEFLISWLGGNDTITDFEVGIDQLVLNTGLSVRSTHLDDANGDGIADLRLTLNNGARVTLLGVSDFADVTIVNRDLPIFTETFV
jgi:uncharacterized protein